MKHVFLRQIPLFSILVIPDLGASQESYFFTSKSQKTAVYLDTDVTVIKQPSDKNTHSSSQPDWLTNAGLTLVPKKTSTDITLGIPVKFYSKAKAPQAILTAEVVAKLAPGAKIEVFSKIPGFQRSSPIPRWAGVYLLNFQTPMAALRGANSLSKVNQVRWAHPNFMVEREHRQKNRSKRIDSDPYYGDQWHLKNNGQMGGSRGADINVEKAWQTTTGDPKVIIALLDMGVDADHPDLVSSWFVNTGEIADNQIDDDKNGYIDDISGWNFRKQASTPSDVRDSPNLKHGTATAGVAGARQNNLGVVGVCPRCTLLPITIGLTFLEDALAIRYAADQGAHVISNSWGYTIGTPTTAVVEEAVSYAANKSRQGKGSLVVFAMVNSDLDLCDKDGEFGLDISGHPNAFAVSGSTDLDKKAKATGWGDCLKLLAPTKGRERPGIATTDVRGKGATTPVPWTTKVSLSISRIQITHVNFAAPQRRPLLWQELRDSSLPWTPPHQQPK